MKLLKVVGNCCCMFLAIIGVIVSLGFGYYHFFVKGKTHVVNYLDTQTSTNILGVGEAGDDDDYEERYFMEANFFSNASQNGIVLQELNFNYFTDYTLAKSTYRSSGMQYLKDLKPTDIVLKERPKATIDHEEPKNMMYYDTTDHISWTATDLRNRLTRDDVFIVKVGDRAFQLQLNKQKKWTEWYGEWYTIGIPIPHNYVLNYTFLDVFVDCMEAIRSNNRGYGDFYIKVKISEYFTIRELNTKTGKYEEEDGIDFIDSYSVLKFHYDENGARNSQQSLFRCINYDPSYDLDDRDINTNYWQERVNYDLSERSTYLGISLFDFRPSKVYGGYFMLLKLDTKNLFAKMPRAKVNITIDLDSEYFKDIHMSIVGFDYSAFENFEIDTLTILGSGGEFHLLNKSLFNTNLQTLRHSKNITLDISSDAINNTYIEETL